MTTIQWIIAANILFNVLLICSSWIYGWAKVRQEVAQTATELKNLTRKLTASNGTPQYVTRAEHESCRACKRQNEDVVMVKLEALNEKLTAVLVEQAKLGQAVEDHHKKEAGR